MQICCVRSIRNKFDSFDEFIFLHDQFPCSFQSATYRWTHELRRWCFTFEEDPRPTLVGPHVPWFSTKEGIKYLKETFGESGPNLPLQYYQNEKDRKKARLIRGDWMRRLEMVTFDELTHREQRHLEEQEESLAKSARIKRKKQEKAVLRQCLGEGRDDDLDEADTRAAPAPSDQTVHSQHAVKVHRTESAAEDSSSTSEETPVAKR